MIQENHNMAEHEDRSPYVELLSDLGYACLLTVVGVAAGLLISYCFGAFKI